MIRTNITHCGGKRNETVHAKLLQQLTANSTSQAPLVVLKMRPGSHSQDVIFTAPAVSVLDPEGHAKQDGSEPAPP